MKKLNIIYKTLFVFVISYLSAGCSKITDVNIDPNKPSVNSATPQILLPSAVLSTAGRVGGELAILGGMWSQFWTQSNTSNQYKNIDAYNLIRTDLNGDYTELFSGALADYNLINIQTKASGQWQYYLMSTVMQAYTYEVLVDLYDQVPYSEALAGNGNIQPKFDDGFTIYKSLIAQIDFALTQNYNQTVTGGDVVFQGNMSKWAQFANTLELKMYLRMINAHPADAQAGITKLYINPNFLSVDAGVSSAYFTDATSKDNPLYDYNTRTLNTATNIRASYTFTSFLAATSDPRTVTYFGTATPSAIHQGDFTATQAQQPTYNTATLPVEKPTDPVWFLTAAESNFLQAEALQRYFGGVGAQAKYEAGITASFVTQGLTTTQAATYLAQPLTNVSWTASTDKIQAIIVQKWVSLAYGCHTLEGFFEQERTGYPKTSAIYSKGSNGQPNPLYVPGQWVYSANGVTGGLFPKRLVFPDVERQRNNNTPTEVPITTKVWWGL
jgi:hypothetical protein